ncbi:MAG: phage terminase large subunit [Alistipes indistinctus]
MFIAYGLAINPASKFLHLSYSGSLVQENSMAVRDIVGCEYFQAVFPAKLRYGDNTRTKWSTVQGGGLYATSTLGQITGFGAGQVEPERNEESVINSFMPEWRHSFSGAIVIDDPLRPDDAYSDTVRESVNRRFETTIRSRVNSRNTPIIIIMQRLHEHDLCGYLQEIEPDEWTVLSIPCIQTDEDGTERALWPFKHSLEELYRLREISSFVFETQYMQNPKPQEGLMYRDFKTYDIIPHERRGTRMNVTDSADTGADWHCSICYVDCPEGCYVTDIIYTKKSQEYTEPAQAKMLMKERTEVCYIESNNGGRTFMRNVERLSREYGNNQTVFVPFAQRGNKEVRIFTHANAVNNLIYFPTNWERRWPEFARDVKAHRKEGRNAHDDAPDTLTMIVEKRSEASGMSDEEILQDLL